MRIKIKKKAIKDIQKIPEVYNENIISFIFSDLKELRSLGQIPDVVKLKGFDDYYRVRIGPYRIGFKYEDNQMIIYRIMDRKDLYKYFP
jgi:mRNA interferase RelE/StbE